MNESIYMRLQAYLDGEMSADEQQAFQAECAQDADLSRLLDAMKSEQQLLRQIGESPRTLPVPHAQFWRGIEDQIVPFIREMEPVGLDAKGGWLRKLTWFVPAGIAACLAFLAIQHGYFGGNTASGAREGAHLSVKEAPSFHEIDSRQQNAGFISFRSETEGVSVVWISNY